MRDATECDQRSDSREPGLLLDKAEIIRGATRPRYGYLPIAHLLGIGAAQAVRRDVLAVSVKDQG